ncbi:MAG: polysaccharide biosynthesis/export protein [Alphaproteobacteria bacterium]|nr:polysaccharide biosynthesis/export protein [Alphaproteobacteria bacterium]
MKLTMWARLAFGIAVAIAVAAFGGASGRAQIISPDAVSPEFIDQVLGDFLARQGRPQSSPLPRESAVDVSRMQSAQGGVAGAQTKSPTDAGLIQAPEPPPAATFKPSPLEDDYSARLGEPITLFGYDFFANPAAPPRLFIGAIPEDYVLGIGDEIIINLIGIPSQVIATRVDLEGQVVLPNIGPVAAAGRRFFEFRADLEAQVAKRLIDTQVFASLGKIRSIAVAVLGEVAKPGVHQLTGLSSVLDSLFAAGGVKRTGSLRGIQVLRGNDQHWIDLYDLLLGVAPSDDLTMQDGDRILVPTIGATVAVAGKVRRPAIYELADGLTGAGLEEVMAFSGGPLRRSGNRLVTLSIDSTGREQVSETRQDAAAVVQDGDIIIVEFGDDVQVGSIFLDGHVRVPGRRSLGSAPSVGSLIADIQSLGEFPYLLFAVLRTHDPYTNSPVFVPIDLQRVLSHVQDIPLKAEDRVIVLSLEDVRYLWSEDVQSILVGEDPFDSRAEKLVGSATANGSVDASGSVLAGQVSDQGVAAAPVTVASASDIGVFSDASGGRKGPFCPGLTTLFTVASTSDPDRFSNAVLTGARDLERISVPSRDCPEIYTTYPDLLPFVLEHVALVKGEVRIPGVYPVAPQTPLNNVVAYAGGVGRDADLRRVEILRASQSSDGATRLMQEDVLDLSQGGMENVFVSPGETVVLTSQFRDRDSKPVLLVGEFVRPGLYEIRRGERLSEVIARAGGLTPQAYPYGAVFTRERIKQVEKVGFQRAARELEIALASALSQQSLGLNAAAGASALTSLADQLRGAEPVGRVVIEADPTVLQVRPELDTVLEGADRLFMPKRPNSVTVIGDVLNEGTLQFLPGARVDEYIDKAGGFRGSADESRVFVILPNGEAQPVSVSAWNYSPVSIPPGSTVVIPKEPAPFDALAFIKNITQITSQLAISAAALAAIDRR